MTEEDKIASKKRWEFEERSVRTLVARSIRPISFIEIQGLTYPYPDNAKRAAFRLMDSGVLVLNNDLTLSPSDTTTFFGDGVAGLFVHESFLEISAKKILSEDEKRVSHIDLEYHMADRKIEEILGNTHLFDSRSISATLIPMIRRQWNGRDGELLRNGFYNLFFLHNHVVRLRYIKPASSWYLDACVRSNYVRQRGSRAFRP